jgi:hypothetical protein
VRRSGLNAAFELGLPEFFMSLPRLSLAAAMILLAACGSPSAGRPGGPGGPGGPGSASPVQAETVASIDCRLKPYIAADGSLTRAALDEGLRKELAAADTSGDGGLQKSEIAALNAAKAAGCDAEPLIDWEGAGRMTYPTFAARAFTLFERADADGDGLATAEEIAAAGQPQRRRSGAPPADGGPGGQQRRPQ